MSQTTTPPPLAARPEPARTHRRPGWWAPAALGAVLALAAATHGWALGSLGWGNTYYSAAVKSMGTSWTAFLFGSFDPAGVVTVDKPPAALWPQVVSSKVFGVHGWALILPQAVAGVAAVLVLHRTVRRWAGEGAGLTAALVLTLTPITVAINRDNNPDTLLVLLLVSAAYALTRALEASGSRQRAATWWLCGSGFLIGAAFLTKMLAGWMVVPAFAAAWLLGAQGTWRFRLTRLAAGGAVLLPASLWWVAMVALWPGERPYIGGSEDGSAWDLVIGYNGLGRVFGDGGGPAAGGAVSFGGDPGLGRLFNEQVGGQISWLLPACAVALAVAVAGGVLRRRGALPAQALLTSGGWVLWGTWLAVCALVFSTQQGTFHPYYTTQLAPAVAALCGGLLTSLARAHRAGAPWVWPVAAATVAATAAWAAVLVRRSPDWHGWLAWAVVALGCAATALIVAAARRARLVAPAVGLAVLTAVLAPGAWSLAVPAASASPMGGTNPTAGPAAAPFGDAGPARGDGGRGGMPFGLPSGMPTDLPALPGAGDGGSPPGDLPEGLPSGMPTDLPALPPGGLPGGGGGAEDTGAPSFPGVGAPGAQGADALGSGSLSGEQRRILRYAVDQAPSARIALAVDGNAVAAAPFILGSDETVIGMGGFMGTDDAPSLSQLERWTRSGELRFVLASSAGPGPAPRSGGAARERTDWIRAHCAEVDPSAYGGTADASSSTGGRGPMGPVGSGSLYDCAAR
ncbi:ArnT family glycosyltransferase [Streptomyces sp. NPDC060194]|uniref:ArnT family glycosyltransferase n=1 Tax=Streptomyces sp. NPDC060194 TaxID=3347069 RepID=UPI0036526AE2